MSCSTPSRAGRKHRPGPLHSLLLLLAVSCPLGATEEAEGSAGKVTEAEFAATCSAAAGSFGDRRIVCADLAALDQTLVYNRFGSFNPFGMMYALRRDISPLNPEGQDKATEPVVLTAEQCRRMTGTEAGSEGGELAAGDMRLRDCKRPRPITLRVNVDDVLLVRISNLLHQPKLPEKLDAPQGPGFSEDFCDGGNTRDANRSAVYEGVSRGAGDQLAHGEVACAGKFVDGHVAAEEGGPAGDAKADKDGLALAGEARAAPRKTAADWPSTRLVNFVVQGLEPIADPISGEVNEACLGLGAVAPGDEFLCMYEINQEGMYFLASPAAPAGGEGDGGSIVHGLFGAVLAERQGSRWYRSQTSAAVLDAVWPSSEDGKPLHSRSGMLDYEKTDANGIPYLNMARPADSTAQVDIASARAVELVHSDLNAIIFCDDTAIGEDCAPRDDAAPDADVKATVEPAYRAFREFSVFFHDELKTFYTRNFQDIQSLGQMADLAQQQRTAR